MTLRFSDCLSVCLCVCLFILFLRWSRDWGCLHRSGDGWMEFNVCNPVAGKLVGVGVCRQVSTNTRSVLHGKADHVRPV